MKTHLLCVAACAMIALCLLNELVLGAESDLAAFEAAIDRHLSAGEYAQAKALAQDVILQNSSSFVKLRARLALAKTYIVSRQFEAAETLTSDVIVQSATDPNLVQALCQIGKSWEANGQADRASAIYKRAADEFTANPFSIWAQKNLCTLYLDIRNTASAQSATDHLLTAFGENPNISQAICNVGDAWLKSGDVNRAIGLFEYVVAHYPKAAFSIWSQKNLCTIYAAQKNISAGDAAIAKLKTAFKQHSSISKALCQVGDAWLKNGDTARAIRLYEYAVVNYPGANHSIWSQKNLCTIYAREVDVDAGEAALTFLKTVFKNHPNVAQALCETGNEWQKAGFSVKAADIFKYVAEHYPDSDYALWSQKNIIALRIENRDFEAARTVWAQLRGTFGNHSKFRQASLQIANLWKDAEAYDEAVDMYGDIVSTYPGTTEALWAIKNLGQIAVRKGQDAVAQTNVDTLMTEYRDSRFVAEAVLLIGEEYYFAGNDSGITESYENAVKVIEKALTLLDAGNPAAANFLYAKGLSLRALEQYGKATEAFKSAYQANARFEHADYCCFAIADCYERLAEDGVISQAEADSMIRSQFTQLLEQFPNSKYAPLATTYLNRD